MGDGEMRQNFATIMDFIFLQEGGYVDHPSDPGGATNWGITLDTLRRWRGTPVTKEAVQHLTQNEAMAIYAANYWSPIRGDELRSGMDCSVMDFSVNAGVSRAVKLLQALVHMAQDGVMGPQTLRAVEVSQIETLVMAYAAQREAYYRSLSTFATFGTGWLRRNAATKARSLALASSAVGQVEPIPHEGVV